MARFLDQDLESTPEYGRWLADFEHSHGRLDTQRRPDPEVLARHYGVRPREAGQLLALAWVAQGCYLAVLRFLARAWARAAGVELEAAFANFHVPPSHEVLFSWPEADLDQGWRDALARAGFPLQGGHVHALHRVMLHKSLRHGSGAHYTPSWLAAYMLDSCTDARRPASVMDPACGAGVFLLQARDRLGPDVRLLGMDLDPVAVFAAKTAWIVSLDPARAPGASDGPATIPVIQGDATAGPDPGDPCPFDLVVGNPPWVNWEYLPGPVREAAEEAWQRHGLFGHKGMLASFVKEDVASLVACASLERFVAPGGRLCFVVRESLLKSSRQGRGFRRFTLAPTGEPAGPVRLVELGRVKPFGSDGPRAMVLTLERGRAVHYPVAVERWAPPGSRGGVAADTGLEEVLSRVERGPGLARPADPGDPASGWLVTAPDTDPRTVLGTSAYKARIGVFTGGANAVFWLRLLGDPAADGSGSRLVEAQNRRERTRVRAPSRRDRLESALVHPLLVGRDIGFWRSTPSRHILLPHTPATRMRPLPAQDLERAYPRAWAWLSSFRDILRRRKGFTSFDARILSENFHALQRVGAYTFAPWKVCWRYIADRFTPCVAGSVADPWLGDRVVVPSEKVAYVGLADSDEAHFVCGVLSSTPYREVIDGFSVHTQYTPGLLERLRLPGFDANDPSHAEISRLCRRGHDHPDDAGDLLVLLDDLVAGL
jgi:tRNA1(Val) A37 N6-methylase TrmN6